MWWGWMWKGGGAGVGVRSLPLSLSRATEQFTVVLRSIHTAQGSIPIRCTDRHEQAQGMEERHHLYPPYNDTQFKIIFAPV